MPWRAGFDRVAPDWQRSEVPRAPPGGGERPSISALGFGVQDFSVDRALQTLAAHGITAVPATVEKPGPKQAIARTHRQYEGGSRDGSPRDPLVANPSGVVFQLHDVS